MLDIMYVLLVKEYFKYFLLSDKRLHTLLFKKLKFE